MEFRIILPDQIALSGEAQERIESRLRAAVLDELAGMPVEFEPLGGDAIAGLPGDPVGLRVRLADS